MPFAQSSELPPGFDHARIGVGVELLEARGVDAGGVQLRRRSVDVAGRGDAWIGHDERVPPAHLAGKAAEPLERAVAEDDPRAEDEVERWNLRCRVHLCRRINT